MLSKLRRKVRKANQELVRLGLVNLTFGNLSAIDKSRKYVAIKPSGINYNALEDKDIVILDISGEKIQGKKNPSLDTPTHLELYRSFREIGVIIHTHSSYATIFAQAKLSIRCFGTTHADYFHGDIPITRDLTEQEVKDNYELNTGKAIVETFNNNGINPLEISACLVGSHGPFVFGKTLEQALENALMLEKLAEMNFRTLVLNPQLPPLNPVLLKRHYLRKHGKDAYYGQDTR